ncbi:hypothetical protein F5Y04DRAFT_179906 [Hypomontagnella monticulosa]|nr:hypothetical protein F5Y04DRAFT_179906 [Hypomontagnella monticulosa]
MGQQSLDSIPGEIQNQIISELGGFEKLMLRAVSKYFRAIIPVTAELLLEAENSHFSISKALYGCYDCLRLRPAHTFSDNLRKKKRRRNGEATTTRFCIECGLSAKGGRMRYQQGQFITVNGVRHVVCVQCNEYGRAAHQPIDDPLFKLYTATWMKICEACWEPIQRDIEEMQEPEWQKTREARGAILRDRGWVGTDDELLSISDSILSEYRFNMNCIYGVYE